MRLLLKQLHGYCVKPIYRVTNHKFCWSGGFWSYFPKYCSYISVG